MSGFRIFINWVLIIAMVVCFGGGSYMLMHDHYQTTPQSSSPKKIIKQENTTNTITVRFKKKVYLNRDGKAKVKFLISPGTKVKIVGHNSGETFKTIKATDGKENTKAYYTFTYSGTYDIVATKGSKKIVKHLKVKDYSQTESSSSSSSKASESSSSNSSSKAAANSSSSAPRNSNGKNTNSSNISNTSNGGGSYHSSGTAPARSYTPAPSRPATPSAPANGTGAMTGGNY